MSKIIYDKPGLRQIDLLPDFGAQCTPSGSSATGPANCAVGGAHASCMSGSAAVGGDPASCSMGAAASCYTGAGAS